MTTKLIKNAYNGGELSAYMDGRTDLNKYYNGASMMVNALVLPHGGFTKRPGTIYKATAGRSNLIPFEFSVDDNLVLEWSNALLRFYKDQAIVNMGVGTETLTAVDGGNLVAHWLLNDTETTTVVNDDNPGTLDGTASVDCSLLTTTGKVNDCFDLDGQYNVYVADAAALSFTDNTDDEPFSIVCWAYVMPGGRQVLVSKWDETTGAVTTEYRLCLTAEGKLQFTLGDTNVDLSADMIAQWYLNDDAADTHVDDVSTNHDGVSEDKNTTDFTDTGIMGKCLNFGGDQAVEIADDNELSFDDSGAAGPFSISAWVYFTQTGVSQTILSKYDRTTGAEAREWRFFVNSDDELNLYLYDESANAYQGKRLRNDLSEGWHHVVATYDGRGGDNATLGISLYVDGSSIGSTTSIDIGTYVAMENTATKVVIGALYGSAGTLDEYWNDKIDNVILFDAEINQAKINDNKKTYIGGCHNANSNGCCSER